MSLLSICYLVYVVLLLIIAIIDGKTMKIPDILNIAILVIAIPSLFLQEGRMWWSAIAGFFVISVPMLLVTIVCPGSFGGGDIKLMAVSGVILGVGNTIIAFIIAVLIGGMYGSYLLVTKKRKRKEHMAFGPYLCIGCCVAMIYGECIIRWYLGISS